MNRWARVAFKVIELQHQSCGGFLNPFVVRTHPLWSNASAEHLALLCEVWTWL
jgi:hypothetical protein